jgi:predicted metal-dependent peptidase
MPIVIPTAEELQRMDARSKAKWQRTLGRIFSQLNEAWQEADEGGETRRQAYLWFQMYGTDAEAPAHRQALLEAVK